MESPKFQVNDEVFIVSQPDAVGHIVREPRPLAGDWWYCVSFGGRRKDCPEASLERFTGGHDVLQLLGANNFSGRESLSKIVAFTKLKQPLLNNLYAYRASRTEFHEYQFKPLVKLLNSTNQRLLIADEVGLGKTIEAGFIYQELNSRHELDRVLIVCPSALRPKWAEEMKRRFGEDFTVLDSNGMRQFLTRIQSYNPFIRLKGICSIQTLRSESLLNLLVEVSPIFDLVIVDEAHHMRNSGTLSNRLGRILSEQAETMLLLTATPIHLGDENLFQLLQILDPEEFDDFGTFDRTIAANRPVIEADRILRRGGLDSFAACRDALKKVEQGPLCDRFVNSPIYNDVLARLESPGCLDRPTVIEIQRYIAQLNLLGHIFTRTKKREVAEKQPLRQASIMRVGWTEVEQRLYDAVTDYCRETIQTNRAHLGVASWFPVITLQRQIASCIPATIDHYLGNTGSDQIQNQDEMSDLSMEDLTEDWGEEEHLSLRDDAGLRDILREARGTLTRDSKFEQLLVQLRALDQAEPGRKVLIFSYFKKTLAYLADRLHAAGYSCVLITGDVPSNPNDPAKDERGRRLHRFKEDPSVRIMLSSEVGSEGLDFQFAHILVNYDLPWNPMVVEQRIGRLDRLGQKSERILIYNFAIPGTIEERILNRLYARIRIFEQTIGDLETILGNEIRQLTLELLSSRLTKEEQDARIEECAMVIEKRRQESESLEQQSAQFIGHDAYFQEELERIIRNKRHTTPRELELLVGDFIRNEFPASRWEPDTREGYFHLKLDKDLANLVRSNISKDGDISEAFFVDGAIRNPVMITCDGELALTDEKATLFTGRHILVQTIAKYYETHKDRLHPVSCVRVLYDKDAIERGDYVYFLYLVEHHSARPGKTLETVLVSTASMIALDEDRSEALFSEMIANCQTLEPVVLAPESCARCHQIAEATLGEKIARRKEGLQKISEDTVTRRLASLEATYKSKRERVVAQLDKVTHGQSDPRYVRMLNGTLRNLDTKHEEKVREIEAGRRVDLHFELVGAGVVRVESNAAER